MLVQAHVPSPEQTIDVDVVPSGSFKAAFRSLRIPVLMVDRGLVHQPVVFANEAFLRLTGHSADELLGRSWRAIAGSDTAADALVAVEAALHFGEGRDLEFLSYRKDGTSFWSALTVSPLQDEAGHPRLSTLALTDISAKRQAERLQGESAERRTLDLQAAVEQKTALLHEVEHRVKNSLQMTASLVLLKARRLQNPEARKVLQEIAERVGALAAAHRLLYASGNVSRFNLKEFTSELAEELILSLPKGQVDLRLDVQPLGIAASKAAPLAVLLNEVIGNAVKHAFPDGRRGQLTIEIGRSDNGLTIAVEDDGVGLNHSPAPEGSFGKTLISMLVHQLKGQLTWHDKEPGTRAEIVIPADEEEMKFE